MDTPTQLPAARVAPDIHALPAWFPIPGLGVLAMNSFLIDGREPVLIDTGPGPLAEALLAEVDATVGLDRLRWVWLTHTDPDHVGAVAALVERAPQARFVTTFLGAGKMALHTPLPPARTHLVNPGGRVTVGDRDLIAVRPPVYDAPETIAAFDPSSATLFAADCFGALVAEPVDRAADLDAAALRAGMLTWASIDAPWLEQVPAARLAAALAEIERLAPTLVLGAHLAPARAMTGALIESLGQAAGAAPFVGPDQAALAPAA